MKNLLTRLTVFMAVMLSSVGLAMADNVVSIEDFEIKPGQQMELAINAASDGELTYVVGDLVLPEGLSIVTKDSKVVTKAGDLTKDATIAMTTKGHFAVRYIPYKAFAGKAGSVVKFYVVASDKLAESATIGFKNVSFRVDGQEVAAQGGDVTVTRVENVPDSYKLSFAGEAVEMRPGQSADFAVELTNNFAMNTLEFAYAASKGISITGVKKGSRVLVDNIFYGDKVRILNLGSPAISGEEGTVITFTVKADDTFEGDATLTLSDIHGAGSNATDISINDVTLNVKVQKEPFVEQVMFTADRAQVALSPESSASFNLLVANNVPVRSFEGLLSLPAGVTATAQLTGRAAGGQAFVENGKLAVLNLAGIAEGEGAFVTITLNADETFAGDGVVAINNIHYSVSGSDVAAGNIAVDVKYEPSKLKEDYANALLTVEDLQKKLDDMIAFIGNNYPAVAGYQQLTDEEQAVQGAINQLAQDIDDGYANKTLNIDDVYATRDDISKAIDALEALAAKLQGNEDGKKAIDDELLELRKKLFEAWWICPTDLPESVDNELYGECLRISDEIDAIESETQAKYDAVELTADSKIDPERKQALLDAIDALYAELLTWQRGDVEFDLDVDMDDFYALTDSILKENLPTAERVNAFYRFDANADEAINVGDMQGIVNICLGLKANGSVFSRQSEQVKAELSVKSEATATGMRYTLSVSGMSYTGFQMDVKGAQVVSESSALTVRKSDNGSKTRILALGMEQQEGQVVTIETTGSARLENVILTQADAQTVTFDLSGTTGISAVAAGQSAEKSYNLSGREVKQARGLVISGGKKMIRK